MIRTIANVVVGLVLAACLAAVLLACGRIQIPAEDPKLGDSAVEPEASAAVDPLCAIACKNLAKLGCPEGDASCAAVCSIAEDAGNPMNTACLANAWTPDEARACGTVRCKGR